MKKFFVPASFSLMFIFLACSSAFRNVNPGGDMAEIKFTNENTMTAEILTVSDSSLLVLENLPDNVYKNPGRKNIYRIPVAKIHSIEIEGYSNDLWLTPVIVFQFLPVALFLIAANSAGAEVKGSGIAILLAPPVLSLLLFKASEIPTPGVTFPFSDNQMLELKKYARFPQGLTGRQLQALLAGYGQEDPILLE